MRRVVAAVAISIVLACCYNGLRRVAYDQGWLDVDVSDGHGHGPDRGAEYDRAALHHISRSSLVFGVAFFPIVYLSFHLRDQRRTRRAEYLGIDTSQRS